MTKDALLEDFLGDLPSYFPTTLPSKVPDTYEGLKAEIGKEKEALSKFIGHVFDRLGYDLSEFENNAKLYELVESIFSTVDSIGAAVKELAGGGLNWDNVRIEQDKNGKQRFTVDGLFTVTEGDEHTYSYSNGGFSASLSFGDVGSGRLAPLFRLLSDLIKLVGKFRDLEWKSIAGEGSDFMKFMEDNYFNKQFAERLFDHILVVLLRNAKTVFDEELRELAEVKNSVENLIKQVKDEVEAQIAEKIEAVRKELAELEKQIMQAAADARDELVAKYYQVRRELERLMKQALGSFGQVGDILEKIYKVLDFFGLVGTQTVEVAKFIKNPGSVPTPDLAQVSNLLAQKFQGAVDSAVADVNGAISDAMGELRAQSPTVEIYVIRWSRLAQIFTDPATYFPQQFPVKDYDDAAALVGKIYGLVRAFNPDIPDFSSVGAIIDDLIVRLRRELESGANDALKKIKEDVNKFIDFLKEVKKALKTYANAIRKEVENGIKEGSNFLTDLQKNILDEAKKVIAQAEKEGSYLWKDANVAFWTFRKQLPPELVDYMQEIFLDPLAKVVREKAQEHDLFKEVDPAAWKEAWDAEVKNAKAGAGTFITAYKELAGEIEGYVTQVFSEKVWKNKIGSLVEDIKKEFGTQTEALSGILHSKSSLADYGKSQVDLLLAGKRLDNPFSSLDVQAYVAIVSDHVKKMVPTGLDGFYSLFKDKTEGAMEKFLDSANKMGGDLGVQFKALSGYPDKIKDFADDVFVAYWSALKESVEKVVIRPFLNMIERKVKEALRELLKKVAEEVKKAIKEVVNNETVRKVADMAADAAALATEVIELKSEAKEISCWEDSLHFAIRVYRAIPPSIKKAASQLVDLPDVSKFFEGASLPDYKLDLDGKFLAVNFYSSDILTVGLIAYPGQRTDKDKDGKPTQVSGVYLLAVVQHKLDKSVNLGSSHMLQVKTALGLDPKKPLGLFFTKPAGFDLPKVIPVGSEKSISAELLLTFRRGQNGKPAEQKLILYGSEGGDDVLSITLQDYPQELYLGYSGEKGFNVAYLGKLKGLNFVLRLQNVNAFFEKILKGNIEFGLDELDLGYALKEREGQKKGLTVGGDFHVRIPLKPTIDLDLVKFDNLAINLGCIDFGSLSLGLDLNFTASLGPITFTLPDLGFGLDFQFMTPDFHFGSWDFNPTFKFPDGIGLALDVADVVKGAGFVKWNISKGEFLGGFELTFIDLFGASAIFLLNTKKPDGSKGFSFMGALSVFFTGAGIQLGMGFSLTAIGVALGLNRLIDTDRMRDAVYDGSLESVMFVKDLEKNLSAIMANMASFYPVAEDHFFFGAMVEITWVEILRFSVGLFIQVPDPVIIIAGGVHLNIADAAEGLISMHSNFMGVFDVHKGISFDATLYDTKFVGIEFHGSVALRIYWAGDTKGFILSAGGFHPSYTPEPGFNIPDMQRIGYKLDCGPVNISNDVYFAITSNTLQFGSDSRLQVGWKKYGISGYMYFNVLFQFKPFRFMFDAGIGAAVKLFGKTLLSIDLYLEVSGPAKWHIAGKAKFKIIFTFTVNFSETWGKSQQDSQRLPIDVIPLLEKELKEDRNWTVIRNDLVDGLVTVYQADDKSFSMNPSDTLSFSQESVPLDENMDKYGEAIPSDATRISIKEVLIQEDPAGKVASVKSSFAPAQYRTMTDDEKLASKSYVDMTSGFALSGGTAVKNGDTCKITLGDIDENIQEEGMNWNKWKKGAADLAAESKDDVAKPVAKSTVTTEPAKGSDLPKKKGTKVLKKLAPVAVAAASVDYYKVGRQKDNSLRKGLEKDVVLRPVHRRGEAGFKRYLAELDEMMTGNVRGFITQLETLDTMEEQNK